MDHVTLDSGKRAEYGSGMVRDTEDGKERFDLLYPLNVPYEAQLVTRAFTWVDQNGPTWTVDDVEEHLGRLHEDIHEHIVRWVLEDQSGDHAARAFGSILALADADWTRREGGVADPPYSEDAFTRAADHPDWLAALRQIAAPWRVEGCLNCNLDMHRCPGCGEPLKHSYYTCRDCAVLG